ncbi:MAG: DUF1934 domain-containing protein [Lachnospiraceae bacterium]|nr:DUF1934 domain-containing protein [Lachnospiraceae bacterium]MBR3598496.1 DUF1934 domain-containing protein [Lachnospiraceae bacterium]
MKVNVEFESRDITGEVIKTKSFAIMELREFDFKLTYVEDLSGEGIKTRSTLFVSPEELRIIRRGEANTDFMYGKNMVHNTNYGTVYGTFPVTVTTKSYKYSLEGDIEDEDIGFVIRVATKYTLQVGEDEPMEMDIRITITKAENVASM